MDIKTLKRIKPVINLSEVAKLSGMKPSTLSGKIKNNRELTVNEAAKIERALKQHGLLLTESIEPQNQEGLFT